MKALLLFHVRVGVRVAVRSVVPLFCAALILIILQMYPAAFVTMIAMRLFAATPALVDYFVFAVLAFLLDQDVRFDVVGKPPRARDLASSPHARALPRRA